MIKINKNINLIHKGIYTKQKSLNVTKKSNGVNHKTFTFMNEKEGLFCMNLYSS